MDFSDIRNRKDNAREPDSRGVTRWAVANFFDATRVRLTYPSGPVAASTSSKNDGESHRCVAPLWGGVIFCSSLCRNLLCPVDHFSIDRLMLRTKIRERGFGSVLYECTPHSHSVPLSR